MIAPVAVGVGNWIVNVPDVDVLLAAEVQNRNSRITSCRVVIKQSAASSDGRGGERQISKVGDRSCPSRSGRDVRQSATTSGVRAGVTDFVRRAVRSGSCAQSCSRCIESELEGVATSREIMDALQQLDLEGSTHRVASEGHITIS
jgi:hypothetical protein